MEVMESCDSVKRKDWKDYMKRIMNKENDWDLNVEANSVGVVVGVSREDVLQALNQIKAEKAAGPSEV